MEIIERDIIIVGAGPCGATAAYFLAQPEKNFQAKSVALLDKATFPRDKYCGDAWCSPALDILEEMHVLQKLESQGLIQDCASGGFVSPSGESFISTGENPKMESGVRCYAIKRIICDEAIVRRAQEVGVHLFENADCEKAELIDGLWKVTCRDGRQFSSKILIAADGAASQLSRSLGIVKTAPDAMASRQYIKGGTHNFKSGGVLFYPDYALPGYVAIFRHYNNDIDVGVYLLENGATKPEDILKVSIDEVARDPFMQRIIGKNAVALERPRVASIRTGGVEKSYATQFMAVGDAAGQTDPLTGEGIHTGMIGAKIAAQTIHEMFAQNDFSEKAAAVYHKRWNDNFGKDFPVSKIGARLTFHVPLFLDAANVVAQRKGDAFMADFGAAMTGVKPKSIFLRPGMALPLTVEVVRQFFIQKILRPYKSMRHAYDMRSIEPSERDTAFTNSGIIDASVPLGLINLESNSHSELENLFRFESTDPNARKVLVLFASEYGFSEEIALAFCEYLFKEAKQVNKQALCVRYLNVKHFEIINWQEVQSCVLFCSTAGDGDPPQNAKVFFDYLKNEKPNIQHCDINVLAMGDSAYPNYCAAGKQLRELLLACGANEILPIAFINSEKQSDLQIWQTHAAQTLTNIQYWQTKKIIVDDNFSERAHVYFVERANDIPKPSLKNPFIAKLKSQQLISKPELGGKETFHISLDISQSDTALPLSWQVGDALAVLPQNPQHELTSLFALLPYNPYEIVTVDKQQVTLLTALTEHRDIKNIPDTLFEKVLKNNAAAQQQKKYELQDLVKQHTDYFKTLAAQDLVNSLSKLSPRYYSIASEMNEHTNTIDLCVASQSLTINGEPREGVASHFLNKQLSEGQNLKVFVHPNNDFRLPNDSAACVMIGAGTGLAPYRAFLQSLQKRASKQTHLLFFGCRHQHADYLYQQELEVWQAQGLLNIYTAFSRDQAEKIYVQNRLRENAELLWQYLESGAHFYICGDATQMAGDVEAALLEIIQQQGQVNSEQAQQYFKKLAKERRYQKDVWV